MAEPFLSEIRIMSFGFPPKGWALCDGQLLPINQNQALFSLLGTTFGGDGRVNFGLPNLQGRFPMGAGNGAGLTPRVVGESSGEDAVTLSIAQVPAHGHALLAAISPTTGSAGPSVALSPAASAAPIYHADTNSRPLAAGSLATVGGGQGHENRQPFLALNFIIAMQGIFPPRS